jgi:hypothetical protein
VMDDPHDFRNTPDDVNDDEADLADLSAETKPRILLMGLKRCLSIIVANHFIGILLGGQTLKFSQNHPFHC